MDRRAVFFLGAAIVCGLLVPATPVDLRWVPAWIAAVYVVLSLLSWLDHVGRTREAPTAPANDAPLNRTDR